MQATFAEAKRKYELWLNHPAVDAETKRELRELEGRDDEIADRFFRDLEFGTGGLRGVIGAGTNRMNRYVVRRATQGLAAWLADQAAEGERSVVIAHDSRRMSREFAVEAACVLAANGIRAYLFDDLRPTPELSFAVRHLRASAGVVVTASHNPPEYNGYKVYGPDGGQLVPDPARRLTERIRSVDFFDGVRVVAPEEAERRGLLVRIGADVDEAYLRAVRSVSLNPDAAARLGDDFQVVYTPLHGTGRMPVCRALESIGVRRLSVVEAQAKPDPEFSTVKSPNPEEPEALSLAVEQARRLNADLVLGTDPDCDRVGAAVRASNGDYVLLTGNQAGALLAYYLLSQLRERGQLPADGAVIKTVVTGELGAEIAKSYGMTVFNTLTGFKYIGEKMTEFERTGAHTFVFGYEESYGYLAGDYARDKDGVVAAMLLAEAAAFYKLQGKTLLDVLRELGDRFGHYRERLESIAFKGIDGAERMAQVMDGWRRSPPAEVAGARVVRVMDFNQGIDGLPRENAIKFVLEDGSWFCVRPSGTEPKMKVYFGVKAATEPEAERRLSSLADDVMSRMRAV